MTPILFEIRRAFDAAEVFIFIEENFSSWNTDLGVFVENHDAFSENFLVWKGCNGGETFGYHKDDKLGLIFIKDLTYAMRHDMIRFSDRLIKPKTNLSDEYLKNELILDMEEIHWQEKDKSEIPEDFMKRKPPISPESKRILGDKTHGDLLQGLFAAVSMPKKYNVK